MGFCGFPLFFFHLPFEAGRDWFGHSEGVSDCPTVISVLPAVTGKTSVTKA